MERFFLRHLAGEIDDLLEKARTAIQEHQDISHLAKNSDVQQHLNNKVDKVDGKGLSTNDYTDEDKAQVAKNTTDITTNAEKISDQDAILSKHGEDIAKNTEDIARKANTTEYYPSMAVGVADNLRGRGEATEEEFTYRPSAGASNSISEEGVATMKRIKGNSLVWNQYAPELSTDNYMMTGDVVVQSDNSLYFTSLSQDDRNIIKSRKVLPFKGHKWLAIADVISDEQVNMRGMASIGWKPNQRCLLHSMYASTNNNMWNWGVTYAEKIPSFVHIYKFNVFDLTQMFGAGNEPTILEEFYARIPEGIDMNAYNEGRLISMNTNAIETTGLNQWDEQWEIGVYHIWEGGTGRKLNGGYYEEYIRSANYIDVLPNTTYCILTPNDLYITVGGFEKNNVFIGQIEYDKKTTSYALITTPINCAKIVFYVKGDKYNNNICISLSHSGVRDGEYEPYKKSIKDLSVIQKYFPNGMKSAGSVYDEITETEAIQRIGEVDLGSLNWEYASGYGTNVYVFKSSINANFENDAYTRANLLSDSYIVTTSNNQDNVGEDYTIAAYNVAPNRICIIDPRYTDVDLFKTAMQGVKLYYELAEPIVTPIVTRDINLNYLVWDWGTERAVSDIPSAPFRADTIYGFNAVDRIRYNSREINGKQDTLTLTVKDNGNIVLGNIAGQTKEFMPATPSGDPMHYKYLKVYGLTYDESTGLWSYRANEGGLTDLTTDEVANMYIVGGSPSVQDNAWCRWAGNIANRYPARMNMFPIFYGYSQGLSSLGNYSFAFAVNTNIKVAVVTAHKSFIFQPKECSGMFRYAQNLERIIGTMDLSLVANTGIYNLHMFGVCDALRDVNIVKLKVSIHFGESPLLSKQTMLGLIQNAIPTSAITITLHAEAYARLANDADILAALAAQPNISLISA